MINFANIDMHFHDIFRQNAKGQSSNYRLFQKHLTFKQCLI